MELTALMKSLEKLDISENPLKEIKLYKPNNLPKLKQVRATNLPQ